jgi:hypothetical protein
MKILSKDFDLVLTDRQTDRHGHDHTRVFAIFRRERASQKPINDRNPMLEWHNRNENSTPDRLPECFILLFYAPL